MLELLDSAEMFLTGRTARLTDFVFVTHEGGQIMSVDFALECAE